MQADNLTLSLKGLGWPGMDHLIVNGTRASTYCVSSIRSIYVHPVFFTTRPNVTIEMHLNFFLSDTEWGCDGDFMTLKVVADHCDREQKHEWVIGGHEFCGISSVGRLRSRDGGGMKCAHATLTFNEENRLEIENLRLLPLHPGWTLPEDIGKVSFPLSSILFDVVSNEDGLIALTFRIQQPVRPR